MISRLILPICVVALLVTPAMAGGRARCDADDNKPGLKIEFGFEAGNGKSSSFRDSDETLWKMQLRQHGVDARTVKRTDDGCLEAYVQNPDGSWNTQYYDEDTFVLVQD